MKLSSILSILALGTGLNLADAQSFIANLDATQAGVPGTGSGSVSLTLSGTTLTLSLGSYSGLSGLVTTAHIHGPGAPGVGANVLYGLVPTFITTGANAGTIAAGSINLVNNAGGLGFDVPTQLAQLNSGLWYVNIHTTTFGGGEIRGQIVLVPEPASGVLFVLGAACTGVYLRRRYVRI